MRTRIELAAVLLVGAVVALTACSDDRQAGQKSEPIEQAEAPLPAFELESELPPSVREAVLKNLDALIERYKIAKAAADPDPWRERHTPVHPKQFSELDSEPALVGPPAEGAR